MARIRRLCNPEMPKNAKISISRAEIPSQMLVCNSSPWHRSVRYRSFPHPTTPKTCLSGPCPEVMSLCGVGCGGGADIEKRI